MILGEQHVNLNVLSLPFLALVEPSQNINWGTKAPNPHACSPVNNFGLPVKVPYAVKNTKQNQAGQLCFEACLIFSWTEHCSLSIYYMNITKYCCQ